MNGNGNGADNDDSDHEQQQNGLLRSHRFMNFNEKEINEYVSSEEEVDDDLLLANHGDVNAEDSDGGVDLPRHGGNKRAQSMIFKPFRPGKQHDALRQIPQSVQEIHKKEPLYKTNQRKLPHAIQALQ